MTYDLRMMDLFAKLELCNKMIMQKFFVAKNCI